MTKLNKALMATTAIVVASGLALPASAQDPSKAPGVVKSGDKIKLKLYGQVTREFGFVNDGEATTFKQGSLGNTSTRMGIDGRGKVTKDVNIRTRMEFALNTGDSHGGNQFSNQAGTNDFDIRHLHVIFSHKKAGAIWIGRGDSATNGSSEVNLAPAVTTGRLGGSVHHVIGEFRLMDKNDGLATQSIGTVDRFFNSFDGAGRQNRIRYDSPTFFGFKASASVIDKHNFDAALRYSGKIAGTAIKAAAGFCETKGARTAGDGACFGNGGTIEGVAQVNGSISVKTPIGLGATFSGAKQWQNRAGAAHATEGDPDNINPSIWYTTKVTELGATTVEYAFQYCKHCGLKDDKGIGHAVTVAQKVDSTGGDYFVGFRLVDVETATNDDIENLWWVGAGFRQRF
jgi:hypothetical protein